jgi:hypothetical protein
VKPEGRGYVRQQNADPMFSVEVMTHQVGVRLRQEIDRSPHVAPEAKTRKAERDSWYRIPKYDETPSLRLTLMLKNGREFRQSRWTDSPKLSLDDCLAEILQEIELRAAAPETTRLTALDRAAQEKLRWQAAIAAASIELQEHHRGEVLMQQATRWHEANRLREYLQALQEVLAQTSASEREDGERWLEWARTHLESLDPLCGDIRMPADVPATAEALQPFMNGWSAHGPYRARGW